jgi:DNA (cytosine-5)-methyltransferase 1
MANDRHGLTTRPTILDTFSGIGGFTLAGERTGYRTVAFAEVDPYASAILRRHWPHIPNLGNVRNITRSSVSDAIDVIAGGFPCQPASISGAMRGTRDPRWLWPECRRLLEEFRPTCAVFENVTGLLSVNKGRGFEEVLRDLAALRYDVLWNCIPASAIGAPHRRDRLWVLAYADDRAGATERGQHAAPASPGDVRTPLGSRGEMHVERQEPVRGTRQVAGDDRDGALIKRYVRNPWQVEPRIPRVAHGIPHRVDHLRCLGNAIVPQVAEIILKEVRRFLQTRETSVNK